jgi:hypothetical protein
MHESAPHSITTTSTRLTTERSARFDSCWKSESNIEKLTNEIHDLLCLGRVPTDLVNSFIACQPSSVRPVGETARDNAAITKVIDLRAQIATFRAKLSHADIYNGSACCDDQGRSNAIAQHSLRITKHVVDLTGPVRVDIRFIRLGQYLLDHDQRSSAQKAVATSERITHVREVPTLNLEQHQAWRRTHWTQSSPICLDLIFLTQGLEPHRHMPRLMISARQRVPRFVLAHVDEGKIYHLPTPATPFSLLKQQSPLR